MYLASPSIGSVRRLLKEELREPDREYGSSCEAVSWLRRLWTRGCGFPALT
jgi:hypothetical protein